MTRPLTENPLLLLFVVVAVGYPLGRVAIRGTSLGVASVHFVHTVGLANGRAFFVSFRRQGARDTLFVSGMVSFGAATTY